MTLSNMVTRGLGFGYRVLGDAAQMTVPGAQAPAPVTVIFSVDGAAAIDGMMQSIGPSLRIRKSEALDGVPRGTRFAMADGALWKAAEDGMAYNDGGEWLVRLGVAQP